MKTVAVVIAACQAERWIHECLGSVEAQALPPEWRMEVRVGVDGCKATSDALASRPHLYSKANVGPYLVRNALMAGPADAYAVFDADDVMLPEYLATLVPLAGEDGIAGAARYSMNEDGVRWGGRSLFRSGVCVISAGALKALGGYRPWPILADYDLWGRAKKAGVPVRSVEHALYRRRYHPGSLTASPETGMRSEVRERFRRMSVVLIQRGSTYVEPECADLTPREAACAAG